MYPIRRRIGRRPIKPLVHVVGRDQRGAIVLRQKWSQLQTAIAWLQRTAGTTTGPRATLDALIFTLRGRREGQRRPCARRKGLPSSKRSSQIGLAFAPA